MIKEKEEIIQLWFHMWLQKEDLGIPKIFSDNAIYIESWGPEYKGSAAIKQWFDEWNTRGSVIVWDIKQYFHKENQTVVEWYFRDNMNNGNIEAFDGISLIRWSEDNRICFLQEFGSKEKHYNPYQNSTVPHS